jgi:DNA-binding response OmpR family regulator
VKILIAEDDSFFRQLLQKLLENDFEVSTAEDGNRAWAMIEQSEPPLLAILDWVMPGMAGPQVCRKARANPRTAMHYLILVTARNSPADILAGMRAGADDYITKPFEPEELRVRVGLGRRVVELHRKLAAIQGELDHSQLRERLLWDQLNSQRAGTSANQTTKGASA